MLILEHYSDPLTFQLSPGIGGEQVDESGGGDHGGEYPEGAPDLAQKPGQVGAGSVGVVGSEHPQPVVERVAVLVGGLGGLPGLAQKPGQVAAGGEGVGVVGTQVVLGDV